MHRVTEVLSGIIRYACNALEARMRSIRGHAEIRPEMTHKPFRYISSAIYIMNSYSGMGSYGSRTRTSTNELQNKNPIIIN